MARKPLPIASRESEGLGLVTVMDREMAATFGAPYVHFAALAIDLDRVRLTAEEAPDAEAQWPFGWDVLLTGRGLEVAAAALGARREEFLDELATSVFARLADGPALGAQIPFAIYAGIARGDYPPALRSGFVHWKRAPDALLAAVEALRGEGPARVRALAAQCLATEGIDPPLAPSTRATLSAWSAE